MIKYLFFFTLITFYSCGNVDTQINDRIPSTLSNKSKIKVSLTAFGDSITLGANANSRYGEFVPADIFRKDLSPLLVGYNNTNIITRKLSITSKSAILTRKDWGLRRILAKENNCQIKDIETYVAAQWGQKMVFLNSYFNSLKNIYKQNNYVSQYVTLFIGANDFCTSVSLSAFESMYQKNLTEILKMHPRSTIIVFLIPNILETLKYRNDSSSLFKCNFTSHWCDALYDKNAKNRLQNFNKVIVNAVTKSEENFKGNIILIDKVNEIKISEEDLSFDCFHLSELGQFKIAELIQKKNMKN